MEDDSHTVEVRFRVRLHDQDADRDPSAPVLYQQMEGKGMLMIDREEGHPSHTMWVVKPISSPEYLQAPPSILLEHGDIGDEPNIPEHPAQVGFSERGPAEPVTPVKKLKWFEFEMGWGENWPPRLRAADGRKGLGVYVPVTVGASW